MRSQVLNPYGCLSMGLHYLWANLLVPTKCLFAMYDLITTAVTCWYKPQIGGKLPLVPETLEVSYFRQQSHCHV